jgi:hypothetical protein
MKPLKVILLFFFCTSAQAQTLSSIITIGGSGDDNGFSIAVDRYSNQYITGYFSGTVDFDPGTGVMNLVSLGGSDIFIAKYSATGNLIWAKSIGGTSDLDFGKSITVDADENVYVTGAFGGSVDFDPGPGVYMQNSNGHGDIFILKLTKTGDLSWAKDIGSSNPDIGQFIKLDAGGNVYTTGMYFGPCDFDPGLGVYTLPSNFTEEGFVCKLSSSGDFIWAKSIAGACTDRVDGLAIDPTGNIYLTGVFQCNNIDFDPGPGTYYLSTEADQEQFISKWDSAGNFLWARQLSTGALQFSQGLYITLDAAGNVYTCGRFGGTTDFDPGPGTLIYSYTGGCANFISKYSNSGNMIWTKVFAGSNQSFATSMAVDSLGFIYTTGCFESYADFDPGSGVVVLPNAGYQDIYINKFTPDGDYLWAKPMGGPSDDESYSLALDQQGNIFTTGYFNLTADFNPLGPTHNHRSSAGAADIFFQKLSQNQAVLGINWASFTAQQISSDVLLKWTASGTSNGNFIVQHSADNFSWSTIFSTNDNSGKIDYSYLHQFPGNGSHYYRIIEKDIDGKLSFSKVLVIKILGQVNAFQILSHASHGLLNIKVNIAQTLSLYDNTGKLLWKEKRGEGLLRIDISKYPKSAYILKSDTQSMVFIIN